ncbi:hypothetical protein ACOMHN_010701 [Nucella lapillus]
MPSRGWTDNRDNAPYSDHLTTTTAAPTVQVFADIHTPPTPHVMTPSWSGTSNIAADGLKMAAATLTSSAAGWDSSLWDQSGGQLDGQDTGLEMAAGRSTADSVVEERPEDQASMEERAEEQASLEEQTEEQASLEEQTEEQGSMEGQAEEQA